MAGSVLSERNPRHRCRGVLARAAYRHAQREGVHVGPLVAQAGLTTGILDDAEVTIDVTAQIRFVELVAGALADDHLGFRLVQGADLREIGMLYYVMASAETLGLALLRLERYIHVENEGVRVRLEKGGPLRATFSYAGIARHTDRHQMSAFIFLLIRIARDLTGRALNPTRVRLMHRLTTGTAEVERMLASEVEDGAGVDQVEFPPGTFELRVAGADPFLHRYCLKNLEDAVARSKRVESLLKIRVENEVAALLPHGQARHDVVAARLGLSARTLARKLASEESSFVEILNEVRMVLAERYIADPTMSISQIAWLLGYAEIGTFTRAYQRWTGVAPSAARRRLLRPTG